MHPTEADHYASMQMPRYRSHKRVWALEIDTVNGHRLSFRDAGYAPIMCEAAMFTRYTPMPGDYMVQYDDGYTSFSPRKAFLDGYTRIDPAAEAKRALDQDSEQRKARE